MGTSNEPTANSAASQLNREDYAAIKQILLQWKSEGVVNPLLPSDVDTDGDGVVDSYGLDVNDNVILVRGANLDDTVYVSEGDDVTWPSPM